VTDRVTAEVAEAAEVSRPLPRALLQEHDGWLYFAAVSGERGRIWEQEFRRPDSFAVVDLAVRTLPLLHRRQLDEGRRLLAETETALESLRARHAGTSILFVLESLYYPLLALYNYRAGELAPAGQNLDRGTAALARAIELEPFLIPLAYRCAEFELHHARIARDRRRWAEMRRHLDRALAMIRGDLPFCALQGGAEVSLAEVQAFFRRLPAIDPRMADFARQLTDDATRHRLFDLFILGIYALPGFVIAYP
jgi:hypothetical protein